MRVWKGRSDSAMGKNLNLLTVYEKEIYSHEIFYTYAASPASAHWLEFRFEENEMGELHGPQEKYVFLQLLEVFGTLLTISAN